MTMNGGALSFTNAVIISAGFALPGSLSPGKNRQIFPEARENF
jgi:hypothetical protein